MYINLYTNVIFGSILLTPTKIFDNIEMFSNYITYFYINFKGMLIMKKSSVGSCVILAIALILQLIIVSNLTSFH